MHEKKAPEKKEGDDTKKGSKRTKSAITSTMRKKEKEPPADPVEVASIDPFPSFFCRADRIKLKRGAQ